MSYRLSQLDELEAEAIHVIREVVAELSKPVMLYSVGKDSTVMLRLAQKAFHPGPIPFPLLHIDTTFKFPEMYSFRDRAAAEVGAELRVFQHPEGLAKKITPDGVGTAACCGVWKTRGLLDGLADGGFDAAFGGARRDEERSRAKERFFSFRTAAGAWDPRNQRPELWSLYNGRIKPGQSIRVFPLSNWTELDVWRYIEREQIEVVPLYYAKPRKVVEKSGMLLPWTPQMKEEPVEIMCRYRSLGCVPCSGAVRSEATTLSEIVAELSEDVRSERASRLIDFDRPASMERKKREGYF